MRLTLEGYAGRFFYLNFTTRSEMPEIQALRHRDFTAASTRGTNSPKLKYECEPVRKTIFTLST
jgi:hypothetical protein